MSRIKKAQAKEFVAGVVELLHEISAVACGRITASEQLHEPLDIPRCGSLHLVHLQSIPLRFLAEHLDFTGCQVLDVLTISGDRAKARKSL